MRHSQTRQFVGETRVLVNHRIVPLSSGRTKIIYVKGGFTSSNSTREKERRCRGFVPAIA